MFATLSVPGNTVNMMYYLQSSDKVPFRVASLEFSPMLLELFSNVGDQPIPFPSIHSSTFRLLLEWVDTRILKKLPEDVLERLWDAADILDMSELSGIVERRCALLRSSRLREFIRRKRRLLEADEQLSKRIRL
ncbi:hypothetical protein QR680_013469 [Steinernema hermaphroditum]|uniref:BTB domain-containing protein n=1 Tax=Steinernema hermaphroditum TaxID=289476 RepID=A0AA39I8E2_9BILA|nr:hypothetical protein QR680_013469 [Steinernema hermaphroditum]